MTCITDILDDCERTFWPQVFVDGGWKLLLVRAPGEEAEKLVRCASMGTAVILATGYIKKQGLGDAPHRVLDWQSKVVWDSETDQVNINDIQMKFTQARVRRQQRSGGSGSP